MLKSVGHYLKDKLDTITAFCWLIAVAASFAGAYLLPIEIPGLGVFFLFRFILPVTMVLYLVWSVRNREKLCWRDTSNIEKWCYIFAGLLVVYSVISLFFALDKMYSLKLVFNFCIDLCFFTLALRLCRNQNTFHWTAVLVTAAFGVLIILGIYEVFFGGIWNTMENEYRQFTWLNSKYQAPIVFQMNTNDYTTGIVLLLAVVLLLCLHPDRDTSAKTNIFLVMACGCVYFLAVAGDGRLAQVSVLLLIAGVCIYWLIVGKKSRVLVLVMLLCIISIQLFHNYQEIVPAVQQYIADQKELKEQGNRTELQESGTSAPDKTVDIPADVSSDEETHKPSVLDSFLEENPNTGERVLSEEKSGGVRVRMLIHAGTCFVQSRGFGVGAGNTEYLAKERNVAGKFSSIHCFLARLTADYGLFALIPLCVIAFLMLKSLWTTASVALKNKDRKALAYTVLFLFALIVYPIASTAPSDAQDLTEMWIYLAFVVLLLARNNQNFTDLVKKSNI